MAHCPASARDRCAPMDRPLQTHLRSSSMPVNAGTATGVRAALVQARDQVERVVRDFNNGHRKVMRGVLSVRTTSLAFSTNGQTSGYGNPSEANDELGQLESRLQDYLTFFDRLAEVLKAWGFAARRAAESLAQWGTTFGAVLGLAPSAYPPAYNVFIALLYSLVGLCANLEDDLEQTVHPLLRKLKMMTEHPKRLLSGMHALESPRTPSSPLARRWRPDATSKNQQHYLHLRSMLLSQLPVLLDAMDRAAVLAVRIATRQLVTFFNAVREGWTDLFDSMKEEGEQYGGTEETLSAWQVRWEVGQQMLLNWDQKYTLGESAVWETNSATWSEISLPVQLSVLSVGPSVKGADASPSPCAPRRLRNSMSFPPGPPSPRRTRQSITDVAPARVLYTIRVLWSYTPPPHALYRGYAFFNLIAGDSFEVVHEYGHPSTHTDLPHSFLGRDAQREDCLLQVRAGTWGVGYAPGDVGWALARFVSPD